MTRNTSRMSAIVALLTLALGATAANAQAAFQTIHRFEQVGPQPSQPNGTLVPDRGGNGLWYGVTVGGGAAGHGTIYATDEAGTVTVLHEFAAKEAYLAEGTLAQGPDASLLGVSLAGGVDGAGTVYRWFPDGRLRVLHAFSNAGEHAPAGGPLLARDGSLYGTASAGGPLSAGVLWRIDPRGRYSVVHAFGGTPATGGARPQGPLLEAADGSLVGTTVATGAVAVGEAGALVGSGTVYRWSPGGRFRILAAFPDGGRLGSGPADGVIRGNDGALYGTTGGGGAGNAGTVFRLGADGELQVVHEFARESSEGNDPQAGLVLAHDGALLGTTYYGGAPGKRNGTGTVFRIGPDGVFSQLHVFDCAEGGCRPGAGLVETRPGRFMGPLRFDHPDTGGGPGSLYIVGDE